MKLKRFSNNIICFVIGFCFVYFTEIACGAFGRSAITTIERRFHVTMQHISYLALAYQVPNLFCLVLMGYLGQTHNRPRIICVCMIILSVAFFMNTLPHLLSEPYNYLAVGLESDNRENTSQLCATRNSSSIRDDFKTFRNETGSLRVQNSNMTPLFWFLVVGSSLTGIGASSFYPLGFTYVDDHSSEHKSALYIAIINTMGFIGNACGYALGGGFLKLWVDIDRTETAKIDILPEDPRWIGAWWLGFVVFGVLALFGALVMFAFPKEMEGKHGRKTKSDHELTAVNDYDKSAELDEHSNDRKKIVLAENDNSSRSWKEPLIACKRMFQNPIYVFSLLSGLFCMSVQVSIVKLYPKYLEVVFGISASQTSYVFGVAVFPATAIATILSGVIMKRMKLDRRGALMMCNISTVVCCATFVALYHVGCDTIDIRGVTLPYSGAVNRETSASCNQACGCEVGSYSPVCGSDATTYLSPCHAGCTSTSRNRNDTGNAVYHMCACINGSGTTQEGVCEKSRCTYYFLLVVLLNTVGLVFGAIITTPFFMVVLRSVPPRDKSLAVGVTSLLVRAAGFIPSQLIFAAVIDSTCLYWSDASEGAGYCKIYNNTLLRHRVFGVALVMQFAALVAVIAAQVFERREKTRILDQARLEMKVKQTEQTFSLLSRQKSRE